MVMSIGWPSRVARVRGNLGIGRGAIGLEPLDGEDPVTLDQPDDPRRAGSG